MAFHLANLIFHAAAAVLLWLGMRELLMPGAWVIAALFALHPLNAEPVSWIANQDWPLGGLLFFGAGYFYLQFVRHREKDAMDQSTGGAGVDPVVTWSLCVGAGVTFILAVLANPATTLLPVVLLLALWWRKRLRWTDYVVLVPLVVVAGICWLLNGDLRAQGNASLWHRGWDAQLAAVGRGMFSALRVIAPISLKVFHNQWAPDQWWMGAFAVACWIGVSGLFWAGSSRWGRGPFVACASFGLIEICSLNWFDPLRRAEFTDSGSYLAAVPVIALVTGLVIELLKTAKIPATFVQAAIGLSAMFMLLFGGVSWARAHVFDSPVSFWQDAVVKDPQSSFALSELAEELRMRAVDETGQGDTDGAKADLKASLDSAQQAVAADSHNAAAERTWANLLVAQGDVKASLPHFQRAVEIQPHNFQSRSEYGSALDAIGLFKEAIPQIDAALAEEPSSAISHQLLGVAYGGLGEETRAIGELKLSLSLAPNNPAVLESLAEQQVKAGLLDDAIQNYTLSMQLDPANRNRPELYVAVAKIRERQYQWAQAVEWYKLANKLDPGNEQTRKALETDIVKAKAAAATRPATVPATKPAV
jgi:tetratricopeptide (TPR) repeat protein